MVRITPTISGMVFVLFLFLFLNPYSASQTSAPYKQVPWSLRDHYSFDGTFLSLDYAKGNAELRIRLQREEDKTSNMNPDVVINDIGFSIELADGRIITNDMLGQTGETEFGRETITSAHYGEGTVFSVKFLPYEGLFVEHQITRFKNWNFLLIAVTLTNHSDTPVVVTRIQSAILGATTLEGISEKAHVNSRNYIFRGGYPVYTHTDGAAMFMIHDPARNIDLALGIIPSDIADSRIDIRAVERTLQGCITSSFSPGMPVAPNQSLSSDPIWFSMDTSPVKADAQFSWLMQQYCRTGSAQNSPRSWVTIPDTHGLSVLVREATAARAFGITHALIPGNWEGRPGSLEGGSPQYPRSIGNAARALRDAGVTPGITLDPLQGNGKSESWLIQSIDGRSWINLNTEKGYEFAVKRIRKVIDSGFGFIVIDDSQITDEVLCDFGITAAKAFSLSLDAVMDAIGTSPVAVLPAAHASLEPVRDEWLSAAATVSRMVELGIGTAPIRCRLQEKHSINEEELLAMRFWRGPIEFIGAPHRSNAVQLSNVLTGKLLTARPQDSYLKAPLSWLFRSSNPSVGLIGSSILQFPGAPPWNVLDTELFGMEKAPSLAWYAENDTPVLLQDGLLKTDDTLRPYGILSPSDQPLFAGTTQGFTLGLERLKTLTWDQERHTLRALLDSGTAPSYAFFLMPPSLDLESAQINSVRVKAKTNGQCVFLPLAISGGSVELKFREK